jgi:hypothetical protein
MSRPFPHCNSFPKGCKRITLSFPGFFAKQLGTFYPTGHVLGIHECRREWNLFQKESHPDLKTRQQNASLAAANKLRINPSNPHGLTPTKPLIRCKLNKKTDPGTQVASQGQPGAGGRTRTGTVSLPVDFESTTSANSITPACVKSRYYYTLLFAKKQGVFQKYGADSENFLSAPSASSLHGWLTIPTNRGRPSWLVMQNRKGRSSTKSISSSGGISLVHFAITV